jgi:signal peptidase I
LVWAAVAMSIITLVILGVIGLQSHRIYAIKTGSMTPTIPASSLVVVELGKYRVGQPITFHWHGGIVTHRLVGVNPDGSLITKGDANRTPDPSSISPREVVGGVIAAPKYLGYWLMLLKSPLGFISLGAIVLLIYQVSVLFSSDDKSDTKPTPKTALQPI